MAIELARRHDAHVTGFCPLDGLAGLYPAVVVGPYPEMFAFPEAVADLRTRAADRTRQIEADFRERLRRNGVNGDWQAVTGLPVDAVVQRARSADLLVLRQADPEEAPAPGNLIEDALMGSGRPLLLVPYAGQFATVGNNVLIGWDGSREATRAVHDMLPLVASGAKVTVLSVQKIRQAQDYNDVPGAQLAEHLARHGLSVTAARTVSDAGISDADILLGYAHDIGADLLVVGGYGHSRTREILLGGVTRDLLHHMTLPVLMSR